MPKQVTGSESTPLPAQLADASNILLLAPSFEDDACVELLADDHPEATRVVAVTYTGTAHDKIAQWRHRVRADPPEGLVLSVGSQGESQPATDEVEGWRVEYVPNAGNLTSLGVTISGFLDAGDERPTRLCFDSLTVLLQYVSLKRAFQFLHAVTSRVRTASAVGHYHLDPRAHDEQTLATIKGLFDAVVEVDENGDWRVTTR